MFLKGGITIIYLTGFLYLANEMINGKYKVQGLAPSKYLVIVSLYSLFIHP